MIDIILYIINNIQLIFNVFFKTVGLTIVSFVMIVIIDLIYIRKVVAGNVKVSPQFSNLLFLPIVPLGFEMLRTFLMTIDVLGKINTIILIMDYIIVITSIAWILMFYTYILYIIKYKIANKEYEPKIQTRNRRLTNIVITIISILVSVLIPFTKETTAAGTIYLTGLTFDILKILFIIGLIICTLLFIINKKKLTNVFNMPFIFVDIIYIVLLVLEKALNFHTNYLSSFFVFVAMAIFFTIESQDSQILTDYHLAIEKEKKLKKGKENFLNNVSHDMRVPIYIMQGYSELALEENKLDDKTIKDMEVSSIKLRTIIDNLINISYIQTDKVIAEQSNYSSNELYEKIISDTKHYNTNENVSIQMDLQPGMIQNLYGDHDKIYRIITKIIYIALSNTSYGQVKLKIEEQKLDKNYTEITYKISNSGHVMTEEMYNMSFEDYIIENNSVHSERIGLLIAKNYTEVLGGEISFKNDKDQGTEYTVKIIQKIVL